MRALFERPLTVVKPCYVTYIKAYNKFCCNCFYRAVTDPRDGKRVALKKLPNVFQSLVSARRVCRELRMLCFFKHDNVLSALDILQPPHIDFFQEMYVVTVINLNSFVEPCNPDYLLLEPCFLMSSLLWFQICNHRTHAEWSPQDHCVSPASLCWPHKSLSISNSQRWV